MNFFRRRRVFRSVDPLDLHPVRLVGHEAGEEERISLLMPRFEGRFGRRFLQPAGRDPFIRIRLDRFGTQTWLLIDGELTVGQIADQLNSLHPGELQPPEETPQRLSKFLSFLYAQRYVTFRELQDRTD